MATAAEKAEKRLSAFEKLKDKGFLADFEVATVVNDVIESRSTLSSYVLDLGLREKRLPAGRLEEMQVFLVAALQADGETLLELNAARDRMIINGDPINIASTGPIRPQGLKLLYELEISTEFLGGSA